MAAGRVSGLTQPLAPRRPAMDLTVPHVGRQIHALEVVGPNRGRVVTPVDKEEMTTYRLVPL